jgi:hypothetical protein
MVSNEHIAAIVGSYLAIGSREEHERERISKLDAADIVDLARMLYRENLHATDERYGVNGTANFDAVATFNAEYAVSPVTLRQIEAWKAKPLTPAQLFCALDNYEFQCAEHGDHEHTEGAKFCRHIRKLACRMVDGYDGMPWGIDHPPPVRLKTRRFG